MPDLIGPDGNAHAGENFGWPPDIGGLARWPRQLVYARPMRRALPVFLLVAAVFLDFLACPGESGEDTNGTNGTNGSNGSGEVGTRNDPADDCRNGSDSSDSPCNGDLDIRQVRASCEGDSYQIEVTFDQPLVETGPGDFNRRLGCTIGDAEVASQFGGLTAIQRDNAEWGPEFAHIDLNDGTEVPLDEGEGASNVGGELHFTVAKNKFPFTGTHVSCSSRTSSGPGTTVIDKVDGFPCSQ